MGETKHRFEALDSLRGVAAATVALFHFNTHGMISNAAFVRNGFLLVDFFFVLSGFVIAASYGDRLRAGFSLAKFLLLRLGRLYPLHLVLLAALVALECVTAIVHRGAGSTAFAGEHSLGMLAANLLLVQPFVGQGGLSWNAPSWSIAVEFWTYVVFALCFRFLGRLVVPAALAIAIIAATHLILTSDRGLNLFHDGALVRCLFGFSLGVVAFAIHRRAAAVPIGAVVATLLEVLVAMLAVAIVCAAGPVPLSFVLPPIFLLVVLVFARQRGAVSRLLCARPFLLIGTLSYSIYMVHQPLWYRVLNLAALIDHVTARRYGLIDAANAHRIAGGVLIGDIVSIATLALTIAVAWVTYRLVELPAQIWSRRRIMGPHPSRAALHDEREAPTF